MSNKIVYLLDRVIGSKGRKLPKPNEYMYWSPFVVHHKPKLQVNGIVGFLMQVVIIYFSYLKN